jgi:two-component system chemotaxis response regulator CheY
MTITDTATVLIVDDSGLSRTMVRKALEAEGFQTLCATDGFDGLKQLGAHAVDAVILDNEMPRMDGIAFFAPFAPNHAGNSFPS